MKQHTLFGDLESIDWRNPPDSVSQAIPRAAKAAYIPPEDPTVPPTVYASELYEAILDALRNEEDPTAIEFMIADGRTYPAPFCYIDGLTFREVFTAAEADYLKERNAR